MAVDMTSVALLAAQRHGRPGADFVVRLGCSASRWPTSCSVVGASSFSRHVDAAGALPLFVGHQADHLAHGAEPRTVDVHFVARLDERCGRRAYRSGPRRLPFPGPGLRPACRRRRAGLRRRRRGDIRLRARAGAIPAATRDRAACRAAARPLPCPAGPSARQAAAPAGAPV